MRPHRQPTSPRTALLLYGLAAAATLATAAVVVGVHRESPRTAVSAHGLLHAAIALRFAETSATFSAPPENPFFAGEPLPYYWAFQYAAAQVGELLGTNPLRAIEALVLVAVGLVWLAGAALGRRLYGGVGAGLAVGLLAFAGSNPWGAGILGWRVLRDGAEVLADDPDFLWGIAHPAMGLARHADPHCLYGPLLNFFLNTTSRPMALALLLVALLALLAWLRRGRPVAWVGLALAVALATASSPIVAGPAIPALGLGLLLARPGRRGGGDSPWRGGVLPALGALVLGGLLALPTCHHLFGLGGQEGVRLGPRAAAAAPVAASSALLLALALAGALRSSGDRRRFALAVLSAGLVLLAASALVELPVGNDTNFFHAGSLLLAVPAAGAFQPSRRPRSPWRGRLQLALVLLVFLPTPAVVVWAYLDRPPVPLDLSGPVLTRTPAGSPLERFYRWVRGETERDAVFVLDPGPPSWRPWATSPSSRPSPDGCCSRPTRPATWSPPTRARRRATPWRSGSCRGRRPPPSRRLPWRSSAGRCTS